MKKVKVYDLPTRFFHWSFAGFFLSAFAIAKLADSESTIYPFHMLIGLMLFSAVTMRILWGILGSRYARFSSFALNPLALFRYFKEMFPVKPPKSLGHNPASSWAALIMMILALGLAFTGVQMAQGNNKEFYEDFHELFGNAFILVVISHVAGVILHMILHRDGIAFSMLTGKKTATEGGIENEKTHKAFGFVYLVVLALWALYLGINYDSTQKSLHLFGNKLQLGESENDSEKKSANDSGEYEIDED